MNWPMNVVPAVWVGLSGLWAESDGSVISCTGPRWRASRASSTPPGEPSSTSAASRPWLPRSANAGIRSKIRPKCVLSVGTAWRVAGAAGAAARAVPTRTAPLVPTATAPAPTVPRKRRRL